MLKPDSTESVALANFCHSFNLSQMVSSPTRVTDTTESLIDVIITSNTKQALEVGVKQCSISDHDLVYAVLRLKKERPKPVYITTRSFKHYQPENFYADTYQVPQSVLDIFLSVVDFFIKKYETLCSGDVESVLINTLKVVLAKHPCFSCPTLLTFSVFLFC